MAKKQFFELIYAPIIKDHLRAIDKKYYSLIQKTIEARLQFEPDQETKNRKPLKRPVEYGADWEIRFGPNNRFRVFYQVDRSNKEVLILAIGEKEGSQLFIDGKEVYL